MPIEAKGEHVSVVSIFDMKGKISKPFKDDEYGQQKN